MYSWCSYKILDDNNTLLGQYTVLSDAKECLLRLYEVNHRNLHIVDTKGTLVYEHKREEETRPIKKEKKVEIRITLSKGRPMW